MAVQDIDKRVEQVVKDHWAAAKFREVKITDRVPDVARGTLYIVSIYDENNVEHENYVCVVGDKIYRYDDVKHLAPAIGKTNTMADMFASLLDYAGVSGIIALLLTITICYLVAFKSDVKIPDLLANALTVILGFYFGSAVQKAATQKK